MLKVTAITNWTLHWLLFGCAGCCVAPSAGLLAQGNAQANSTGSGETGPPDMNEVDFEVRVVAK
jgi:hypothetical protein